jgi:hypothetical protein
MSGLQKTPRDDAVEMIFNLCLVENKHIMYMHKSLLKNQCYHINSRIIRLCKLQILTSGLRKTPRNYAVEMIFNLCLVKSKHVMYMHRSLLKNQFYHINSRIKVSANCKY